MIDNLILCHPNLGKPTLRGHRCSRRRIVNVAFNLRQIDAGLLLPAQHARYPMMKVRNQTFRLIINSVLALENQYYAPYTSDILASEDQRSHRRLQETDIDQGQLLGYFIHPWLDDSTSG